MLVAYQSGGFPQLRARTITVGLAVMLAVSAGLAAERRHVVKKSETLSDIAQQYGVTIQLLVECNDLKAADKIYAGQTLAVPQALPAKSAPPEPAEPRFGRTVTVRKSETLSDIAARHGVTVDQLARHNGIDKPNQIYAGQTLRIPGKADPPRVPALAPALKQALDRPRIRRSRWQHVVIHHSGTDLGTVKGMDAYHREHRNMENGLAYHFVIGNGHGMGDGEIAIGSRWARQLDGGHLHSDELNANSLGICLVGHFDRMRPTPRQIDSLRALLAYLLDRCKLKSSAIQTHQQINPVFTRCPGSHFSLSAVLDGLKTRQVAGEEAPSAGE